MFKKIAIASATAALFGIGQGAWAGQTTNTMNVTANVTNNCLVTTAPTDFTGAYDPVSANASSGADVTFTKSVIFKCTKSASGVTVGITNGADYGLGPIGASSRAMKNGSNYLSFELYQPSAVGAGGCATPSAQVFGTAGGALLSVTGVFTTGATNVTVEICGNIPKGQDVAAASYTEAVVVNVNY
jgi:spore coat protein U-like protein